MKQTNKQNTPSTFCCSVPLQSRFITRCGAASQAVFNKFDALIVRMTHFALCLHVVLILSPEIPVTPPTTPSTSTEEPSGEFGRGLEPPTSLILNRASRQGSRKKKKTQMSFADIYCH